MYKVGLTGGIGSGKTTAAKIFETLGVPVYNSDEKAKFLMENNEELIQKITKLLGNQSYKDGELNKAFIASIVFTDKQKLEQLEKLVHPAVKNDFLIWADKQKAEYVVMENAILHKSGMDKLVDYVILVVSSAEIRENRVMKRDNSSIDQVRSRMKNQDNDEKLLKKSNYVLRNNGSISDLRIKLRKMDFNLKKMLKKC